MIGAANGDGSWDIFAAPIGSPSGQGTPGDPLDLATLLSIPSQGTQERYRRLVSGVYSGGAFDQTRGGVVGDPILFRGSGLPVIDNPTDGGAGPFVISADYAEHRDLVFTCSHANRSGASAAATRGGGPGIYGQNSKVINCLELDTGGISSAASANGIQFYGHLSLDVGWYHSDRGHGHGAYLQHSPHVDHQEVRHGLFAFSAATGIKTAGDAADASSIHIIDTTVFRPNVRDTVALLAAFYHYSNDNVSEDVVWSGTRSFVDGLRQGWWIGWQEALIDGDLTIAGCWHHGGHGIQINKPWASVTVTDTVIYADPAGYFVNEAVGAAPTVRTFSGNTYYGGKAKPFRLNGVDKTFAEWQAETGQDADSTYHPGEQPPAQTWVDVNEREDGRAHITVWNPASAATVNVDLDAVLDSGQAFYVYNALNPLAGPISSGTYTTGAGVDLPCTGLTNRTPVGLTPVAHDPTRCVFVVRTVPTWVAPT